MGIFLNLKIIPDCIQIVNFWITDCSILLHKIEIYGKIGERWYGGKIIEKELEVKSY